MKVGHLAFPSEVASVGMGRRYGIGVGLSGISLIACYLCSAGYRLSRRSSASEPRASLVPAPREWISVRTARHA